MNKKEIVTKTGIAVGCSLAGFLLTTVFTTASLICYGYTKQFFDIAVGNAKKLLSK